MRWLWIGLLGCNASGTSTVNLNDNYQTDSASELDTDDENTEVEPENNPLVGNNWYGERVFEIAGLCEETLIERGSDISDSSQGTDLLTDQCPDCLQAFQLEVNPSAVCDDQIGVGSPTYRTTYQAGEESPELHFYTDDGGFQLVRIVELSYEDGRWVYGYSGSWGQFQYTMSGFFELTE